MIESWREILYPLGFLAAIAFGARFILQWLKSEIRQKSILPPSFWKLSLVGNVLLFIHSFIQLQFHVCVIQIINGVISWRNLNLMKPIDDHYRTRSVVVFMLSLLAATVFAFFLQGTYSGMNSSDWFRIPTHAWSSTDLRVGMIWHLFGFMGLILFNSRFWIQWWHAEKMQISSLNRSFWWISLLGTVCTIVYFARIQDAVNLIGPALGIIPYIRNLMLLSKTKSQETSVE